MKLTKKQIADCWCLVSIGLEYLDTKKRSGKPFLADDVPGFGKWACSEDAWLILRPHFHGSFLPERNPLEGLIRAHLGLPCYVAVYGGEVGVEYPRWTTKPTLKEIKNLNLRKLRGGGK